MSVAFSEGLSVLRELDSIMSSIAEDSSCPKNKFLIELRILI
jgi:hypothetical protein